MSDDPKSPSPAPASGLVRLAAAIDACWRALAPGARALRWVSGWILPLGIPLEIGILLVSGPAPVFLMVQVIWITAVLAGTIAFVLATVLALLTPAGGDGRRWLRAAQPWQPR